jgi:predicted alpha-1,2-mannosidase
MRGRAILAALALAAAPVGVARPDPVDLTRYVDPMIGTFGAGFVFPGPAAPYGMVQLSPDTDGYFAYTGYLWSDQFIRGFSHVHVESMGVHAAGDVPFMPTVGPILSTHPNGFKSRFNHATEQASPGYYRVLLDTYGVEAELTAGLRVGMHRYTFPPSPQANVIIDAGHGAAGTDLSPNGLVAPGVYPASLERVDGTTVTGSTVNVEKGNYPVHFAARFSRPFAFSAWSSEGGTPASTTSASGMGAGAVVSFDTTTDRTVLVKVGISFVSRANALLNLESELPGADFDFDALREDTRAAWDDALHAIEVTGGTPLEKRSFYTALYHAQHHPNVFMDSNGQYLGNDHNVHTASGFTYYTNFSMWDTYRGENQLLALIEPGRYRDMMHSLRVIADEGGRLPRWNLMNDYADFMNGEPEVPTIVDGYCRGLVPAGDVAALYAAMRIRALDPAKHRDPSFLSLGWIPYPGSGASGTLEHAIADFALALMAQAAGQQADVAPLLALADNWRNVFDSTESRFVRPRKADGSWLTPYHPELPDGFREGTGWQYTWLAPHDVGGLFGLMGADLARERLDTFFSTALAEPLPYGVPEAQKHADLFGLDYYGNQYAPVNEHDLQAPYLYDWAGQPWKTQAIVRGLQGLYRPTPDGLPGNDDLGSMSAWFIWSALGFYPAIGGAPVYLVGSPLFQGASIRMPSGPDFVVSATHVSVAGKYVQSATLNGAPLPRAWFTHASLVPGGSVAFAMGPTPNTSWASAAADAPPSLGDGLAAFGCAP